jgi:hypothetical protein
LEGLIDVYPMVHLLLLFAATDNVEMRTCSVDQLSELRQLEIIEKLEKEKKSK